MTRIIARSVFAAALCGACATVAPLPNDRLAATEASYRGAQEAGGKTIAKMREVKLGQASGNGIVVLSGVQTGEKVITSGSATVTDGEVVQVVP